MNEVRNEERQYAVQDAVKRQLGSRAAVEDTGRESISKAPANAEGLALDRSRRERFSPLWELTLCRLKESLREPELVFWVFVFPVLLTCALGIAFRNTTPERTRVAVEIAAAGDAGRAADLARSLSQSPDIQASAMSPDEASRALRTGKIALVIGGNVTSGARTTSEANAAGSDGSVASSSVSGLEYRYDPTRPDSRGARMAVA